MHKPSLDPKLVTRLEEIAADDQKKGINCRFKEEASRAECFSYDVAGLYLDISKTHVSDELRDIYLELAKHASLLEKRHGLFSGEKINITENRAVLHPLLRDVDNQGIQTHSTIALEQARDAKKQLLDQAQAIQALLEQRSKPIKDIIHIGIGGSSLGTKVLFEAVAGQTNNIKIHFVGNIDAHELLPIFSSCDPLTTIVIGVSKTFSTAETLQNIRTVASWYETNAISDYWQYFYAVTANFNNAVSFGINSDNIVTFPEWVGGRYSVWSSVSLSAVLVMGIERFEEFLSGAAEVDQYFYQTGLKDNACFLTAMLDHYYTNFMASGSKAVFAYDTRLDSLVDYLQQLETESNGKDRQIDGSQVDQKTSTVVWGGVGTNVQHSVFQMLHQGTSLIPSEFIIVKKPDHDYTDHHDELLANAIAQPAALLSGQSLQTVRDMYKSEISSEITLKAKIFSGEKPSTVIVLDRLTPKMLGRLLAFYEHRVFCSGALNNINSYDQMGVELGKRLAKEVRPLLTEELTEDRLEKNEKENMFDPSTLQLVDRLRLG